MSYSGSSSLHIADWADKICGPVASTEVQYTDLANALAGMSSGQVLLVKAGTYAMTADMVLPNGVSIVLEDLRGGVIVDFGGGAYYLTTPSHTAKAADCADYQSNVAPTTVSIGAGHGTIEAAVDADPTAYSVVFGGILYPIQSINTSTHVITVSSTIPSLHDGSQACVFILKNDYPHDVTMKGRLTLQNTSADRLAKFSECVNYDLSGLKATLIGAGVSSMACVHCHLGSWTAENQNWQTSWVSSINAPASQVAADWRFLNIATACGASTSCSMCDIGSATEDDWVRGLRLSVEIANCTPTGAQADIAMYALLTRLSNKQFSITGSVHGTLGKGAGVQYDLRYAASMLSYSGLGYGTSLAL
jgi:hypothetical protein